MLKANGTLRCLASLGCCLLVAGRFVTVPMLLGEVRSTLVKIGCLLMCLGTALMRLSRVS